VDPPFGKGLADGEGAGEQDDGDSPPPAPQPPTPRPNGACTLAQVFEDNKNDFVSYNFVVHYCLNRESTDDYLQQRRSSVTCRPRHLRTAMVDLSVDLHTKKANCCINGCIAFPAGREALTECDLCKAQRCRANGQPTKRAIYWSILPWLRLMLAGPAIGPGIVSATKEAHEEAAAGPPNDLRDWFDCQVFRTLAAQGYFSSDTCTALSTSTDGCREVSKIGRSSRQNLMLTPAQDYIEVVSHLILAITPGPGQPADLESFLHPIAEELNALAAGVSGISVTGFAEPQVVHELVVQFTTDIPAGDKLLDAIGGSGEYPGRFLMFSGLRNKSRYYYTPHAPGDPPLSKRRRFLITGDTTPRRTAASVSASATKVETARQEGHSKAAVRKLAQKEGFTGYSLFFAPSAADKARYAGDQVPIGNWAGLRFARLHAPPSEQRRRPTQGTLRRVREDRGRPALRDFQAKSRGYRTGHQRGLPHYPSQSRARFSD